MSGDQAYWSPRYQDAAAMLNAAAGVSNGAVFPHWLDADRFWYRRDGESGPEYLLVDAARGVCQTLESEPESDRHPDLLLSPDGQLGAFLRGNDIWVRDLATGNERPLTQDGGERYRYARRPAAFRLMHRGTEYPEIPEACWSPDSTRLFTLQTDERHVPVLPLIDFVPPDGLRPSVIQTPSSGPTDEGVSEFRLVVIDVSDGRQTEPEHPRLDSVRMNDTIFSAGLAWWSVDNVTAYFVALVRGERMLRLVAFDTSSGATTAVFGETNAAYIDLGASVYQRALLLPLPDTDELIWYSERSGYGHLYLYDLKTGVEKRQLTTGDWQVSAVLHLDPQRRDILLLATGIAPDESPYPAKPCLVSLDGGEPVVLSSLAGDHIVWQAQIYPGLSELTALGEDPATVSGVSPTGEYFIETVGTPSQLPQTILRRRTGEQISVLERADDHGLPGTWSWPEQVSFTAADGETELYGLLFKPFGHDPAGSYPLIDFIYPGPQMSQVPRSAFAHGGVGTDQQLTEAAHLAALGAYVLMLDARGTSGRSREFHLTSYGAVQDASRLDDHIAAIRQLAERDKTVDLARIAATGFSAGGYAAANAALRYGDFFKVTVAGGGNYDMRLFWHSWGDRYHGGNDPGRWEAQAVKNHAEGLSGKLLLIHGLLDPACNPAGMFQLVQALIDADRDFDLVIEPTQGHQLGPHGLRKRLDYFVTHLFAGTPPADVQITPPSHR